MVSYPYYKQIHMLEISETGKASGLDTFNNYILKNCAHELSAPLAELFNASFRSATVPILWKEANVTHVYKKDDSIDCRNYMPISWLSTSGKV